MSSFLQTTKFPQLCTSPQLRLGELHNCVGNLQHSARTYGGSREATTSSSSKVSSNSYALLKLSTLASICKFSQNYGVALAEECLIYDEHFDKVFLPKLSEMATQTVFASIYPRMKAIVDRLEVLPEVDSPESAEGSKLLLGDSRKSDETSSSSSEDDEDNINHAAVAVPQAAAMVVPAVAGDVVDGNCETNASSSGAGSIVASSNLSIAVEKTNLLLQQRRKNRAWRRVRRDLIHDIEWMMERKVCLAGGALATPGPQQAKNDDNTSSTSSSQSARNKKHTISAIHSSIGNATTGPVDLFTLVDTGLATHGTQEFVVEAMKRTTERYCSQVEKQVVRGSSREAGSF